MLSLHLVFPSFLVKYHTHFSQTSDSPHTLIKQSSLLCQQLRGNCSFWSLTFVLFLILTLVSTVAAYSNLLILFTCRSYCYLHWCDGKVTKGRWPHLMNCLERSFDKWWFRETVQRLCPFLLLVTYRLKMCLQLLFIYFLIVHAWSLTILAWLKNQCLTKKWGINCMKVNHVKTRTWLTQNNHLMSYEVGLI